jgi:multidrug efflux pump subunit AcrB
MNISEPFIRRPVGTSLLAAGVLLLGAVAYYFLPVAPLPKVDFPTISVSAQEPGVDPQTAASSLAAPLERRFAQIAGVSEITSVSSLGGSSITIQFDLNRDINGAARDVQSAINAASGELPTGLPQPPSYRKVNPSDAPVMVLAMTSDALPLSQVYNLADQIIGQRISQVDGVSQVTIGGGANSAVRVQINPVALASMGLSMEDIRTTLSQANVLSPKGAFDGPEQSFVIASNDQLTQADQYLPIIVAHHNGAAVPLRDVGTAIDAQANRDQAGLFNNKRAVLLVIFKQPDANVVRTTDQIHAILPQLRTWLPPSVHLDVMSDRTNTIRSSVRDVQLTLVITMALVVMVMFLFLRRFWPTFISGITMPLAFAGTFGVMWLCSYSLDNLSLMALTVSTGFVVDDAIVVIENIVRFIEKGEPPLQAALKGARQIGFTVISISLSLVAVFIPLLVHERLDRAFVSRIRGDVERGDSRFRRRFVNAHAHALRPIFEKRGATSTARCDRSTERARFQRNAGFLRTRLEVGPQTRIHHAHCHRAGDHRDRLPLLRCAEGIFPATGHRTNDGHDRGRAGHFL